MDLKSQRDNNSKIIEVNDLTLKIENKIIFKDVNFNVNEGEMLLLYGKSGSGKSSLINCIARIIPTAMDGDVTGKIIINGKDISDSSMTDLAGTIGFLMQDPDAQLCTFTVEDEVAFGLENLKISRDEISKRIDSVFELFNIGHLRIRPLNELSGGQKQKVAFASVVAMDPDIYILDEPTANLDPITSAQIVAIIKELSQKKNKTVIAIEHNTSMLEDCVDKLYNISENKMIDENVEEYIEKIREESLLPVNKNKASEEVILSVDDVEFFYGHRKILNNISFDLRKGEVLGIVGHNGAGKSTLANILSGLRRKFKGTVLINSKNINDFSLKELGKNVGLVFQNPEHQFIKNTVEEELALGLEARNLSQEEIDKAVDKYLDIFSLSDKRKNNPFQLSQGEKRKLSTADMLITGRNILILDEPTFGQDRENLGYLLELLYSVSSLEDDGVGIIMISHDMEVIRNACHKVLELSNGEISYYGDADGYEYK